MRAITTKPFLLVVGVVSILMAVLAVTINLRSKKVETAELGNEPFPAAPPSEFIPRRQDSPPTTKRTTGYPARSAQPKPPTPPKPPPRLSIAPGKQSAKQEQETDRFSLEMQVELDDKKKPRTLEQQEQQNSTTSAALLNDYLRVATGRLQQSEQTTANPAPAASSETTAQREFMRQNVSDDSFYLTNRLQDVKSKYEVKTGTFIPALLITGINSDLPGYVTAQVSAPVYDTVTGRYLLIPQGSRLFGTFDSGVFYGQKRVLVVWMRLTLPDGASITLGNMPGTDGEGYAGVADLYDDHFIQAVGAAFLLSMIGGVATASSNSFEKSLGRSEGATVLDETSASFVEQLAGISGDILRKSLHVKPTIIIRPGKRVNVIVNKDMVLKPYKE